MTELEMPDDGAKIRQFLSERFLQVITLRLQKESKFLSGINLAQTSQQWIQAALAKIESAKIIEKPGWSVKDVMPILHQVIESKILDLLVEPAKAGVAGSENRLFSLLRIKLIERAKIKNWRGAS